jgi:hypothetical protein
MTEPSAREVALVNPPGTGRATPSLFELHKPNPITINTPSEHTRQRRRTLQVFPATEGWFLESERLANRSQQADENQEKRD